MRFNSTVPLLAATFLLTACSQYATISKIQPRFTHKPVTGTIAYIDKYFSSAIGIQKKQPVIALGELLVAAEAATQQLARNPNDTAARDSYNFAVARIVSIIQKSNLDPWTQPLPIPTSKGNFLLSHKPDPRPAWNPALYNFTPADEFDVAGTYVTKRHHKQGLGASLVASGRSLNKNAEKDFALPKTFYGVTALLRFQGNRAILDFKDPLETEQVTLVGQRFPMAADFTVPLAVLLANADAKKLELARLLKPAKYAETARIARLQPYDPNKTVVLVIHGLMDSPATWAPMINELRADEQIRRNYQFWFYSYPSGYPYPHSAAILRRQLDAVAQRFPMQKKMVVIGHSMGGCISRLLITDTDQKIWMTLFKRPPEQVSMSAESKQLFSEALIFKHRPEVGRVIFIAAPLQGSNLATNWVGRIGATLVKTPNTLLQASNEMFKITTFQSDELELNRAPTSVDTLAPNNRFVKAINTIPVRNDIPHHVICGDRGKGGNRGRTEPIMSDGVVPYWSSHMTTAQSELIVPSNHSAQRNPQTIEEVKRILKTHAQ